MHRLASWLLVAVVALTACTGDPPPDGPDPAADALQGDPGADDAATEEAAADATSCRHDDLEDAAVVALTGDDPVDIGTEVAARTHRCAPVAVVAPTGGWEALLAVSVARVADAPLLLVDPASPTATSATFDELAVEELIAVGTSLDGLDRPGTELTIPTAGTSGDGLAGDEASGDDGDERPRPATTRPATTRPATTPRATTTPKWTRPTAIRPTSAP
jgi:hypothetical protein